MKAAIRVVGPDTLRMLELGHPWVIADSYTRKWPQGRSGEVIALTDDKGARLAMALLDPADRIVARVLSCGSDGITRPWLAQQLSRALAMRSAHAELGDSSAYRLVNSEGDGLPGLTVDRYGDYLMIQLYTPAWKPYLEQLVAELQLLLAPKGIYEKFRPQQTRSLAADQPDKKFSRLLKGEPVRGKLTVLENGLNFLVDLEAGLNTGLFLDQRRNRRDLMPRVAGKRVLNLFAFTGAFSVAAAVAGAERVCSVDASAAYLDWAKENFGANRLNPKRHEFITGDCFAVLEELQRQNRQFDLILMDPPSFSTTGKSRFTTKGGTAELVALALALLPAGGLLITSSNHQKVELADYLKELRRGALQAHCDLRVLQTLGQPEDFPFAVTCPEGRYLKYVIAAKS
ncbi:MAG: class I SAM-dependent rRNA methyltransferase [Trichloromonadaceae bacterium]